MSKVKSGSVIQANENAGELCGCLLMVSEVEDWGVLAFVKIPYKGCAYFRLTHSQYDYIGEAPIILQEDE